MNRTGQAIFDDLAALCSSPGYAHAIAYLCFRDNMVRYANEITPDDLLHTYSSDRLIRTEISTLIGLMLKTPVDYSMPTPKTVQQYIDRTEALLQEFHDAMSAQLPAWTALQGSATDTGNPFQTASAMQEPIFYAGESAYGFQYRDLSALKYGADNPWLQSHKGFSIEQAREVVLAIQSLQEENLLSCLTRMHETHPDAWTMLPGYLFTCTEIEDRCRVDAATVGNVLEAFSVSAEERNEDFSSPHDFNVANARPLLKPNPDTYLLFQGYSIFEALYDTPFYWMVSDDTYYPTAMYHRGRFTETFARDRLALVFGAGHVFSNVNVMESKGKQAGEIDVLVLFGDRALVLQAKSKRLTLDAKKGNDHRLKDDFKKSVQDSYDQAFLCASRLGEPGYTFVAENAGEIAIPNRLKEIYTLCVVSDHYPALSFQARQFLAVQSSDIIRPPYVLDIFTLDAVTEMLQSPLQFLSFLNRRAKYDDRLLASHELIVLAYHLKCNLWLAGDLSFVHLGDDISADLDVAMAVRRDGLPGRGTPDGILTRHEGTTVGRLIREIEAKPDPATINLGFLLLAISEDGIKELNEGIDKLCAQARIDQEPHDITLCLGSESTGLTVHCSDRPAYVAGPRLQWHCVRRKYMQKARMWFGLCLHPRDQHLRFGVNLDYPWKFDPVIDEVTRRSLTPRSVGLKVGRNDPCPCGSGKKYKKCCLGRT
jgi:SEC-C motif